MFPYNPQNTNALQSQGIMDLGMRLLAASGPQHPGATFGSRLGQAGVGNLDAMRKANMQMHQQRQMKAQQQAAQQKAAREQMVHQLRMGGAKRLEETAMSRGPLSPQENTALDMGMQAILSGQKMPEYTTDTLYGKAPGTKVVGQGAHLVDETGKPLYKNPAKGTGAGGAGGFKSADENLIRKLIIERHGGIMDEMGNVRALDPNLRGDVLKITKLGTRIYLDGLTGKERRRTRAEAAQEAMKRFDKTKNDPLGLR